MFLPGDLETDSGTKIPVAAQEIIPPTAEIPWNGTAIFALQVDVPTGPDSGVYSRPLQLYLDGQFVDEVELRLEVGVTSGDERSWSSIKGSYR